MSGVLPQDFEHYFPWACNQFQIDVGLFITCDVESPQVKKRTAVSARKISVIENRTQLHKATSDNERNENMAQESAHHGENTVAISTTYDTIGNLTTLKFLNNKHVPTSMLKVLRVMIKCYLLLNNITIDRGIDNSSLYELCKILGLSSITEITLDNTNIPNGCYYILLENESSLKYLSLRRCNIDADCVKLIASKLTHPFPASKTLTTLNLASNKIKDAGAKYLAESLKLNKQLAYLNLSDNYITDEGAAAILDALKEFRIPPEELKVIRTMYLKECKERIDSQAMEAEGKSISLTKMKTKKKATIMPTKKKNAEKETQTTKEELINFEVKDPLSPLNRLTRDGHVYSKGNNYLAYINLAYNSLSYCSVKKLLDVMLYQQTSARVPRGLLSVCLEGNYIPNHCLELEQIDKILHDLVSENEKHAKKKMAMERKYSIMRK